MKILYYAKIDFMKLKDYAWFLLFPILSCVLVLQDPDAPLYICILYSLFGGVVCASLPFASETRAEAGFLQLLPSREGDNIRGHFLFSFFIQIGSLILGLAASFVVRLFQPQLSFVSLNACGLMFSFSLILVGIQNLMYVFFRYQAAKAVAVLRLLPAFLFFYGGLLANKYLNTPAFSDMMAQFLKPGSLILTALCAVLYLLMAQAGATLSTRKG